MTDHSDWEFFQDEGYFGMWCVREKGARRFGEGFHTVSKEEAEALASALSSQSLSLSEAREEIERLRKEVGQKHDEANRYVNEMIEWRSAFQRVTPGGSEFTSPQAVRDWADMLKMQVFEANKRAVLAERKVRENGPAGLADATSNPPLSDLSSLRKGAEELRRSLICVKQQCETAVFNISQREHDEAVVRSFQSIADYCARALVSGSREDGA